MCDFFEDLDRKQGKTIEKAKGVRGESTKETVVYGLLSKYSNFKSKIVEPTIEESKEVA